ncbi:hypothetical protein WMZ97_02125 [Lentibacillus sp. N15]
MSWKSVEMQVALPRTVDAGKIQEQMHKQPQHVQESAAVIGQKQIDQKRKQVNKFEKSGKSKRYADPSETKPMDSQHTKDEDHPYLGTNIDFSG